MEFSLAMKLVADELLDKEVATKETYSQSASLDMAREILHASPEYKLGDFSSPTLRDFIKNEDSLGPYEKHILCTLLLGPSKVVAILGGLGCGKSSSMKFVKRFVDENRVGNQIEVFLVDGNLMDIHFPPTNDEAIRRQQWEHLLGELDRQVYETFCVTAKTKNAVYSILASAQRRRYLPEGKKGGIGSNFAIIQDVMAKCGGLTELKSALDNGRDVNALIRKVVLEEMKPGDMTSLTMALMQVRHLQKPLAKRRSILIVDNLDPLPRYLQKDLLVFLLRRGNPIDYMVAVPLRLSTFEEASRYHPFSWYPHSGPLPLEILFSKLAVFLANPKALNSFQSVTDRGMQSRIYFRVTEFFFRFLVGSRDFRDIFESIAGHNVRNAYDVASGWLRHINLRSNYPDLDMREVQEEVRRHSFLFFCEEVIMTLSRVLRTESTRREFAPKALSVDGEEMAKRIGVHLAERLAATCAKQVQRFIANVRWVSDLKPADFDRYLAWAFGKLEMCFDQENEHLSPLAGATAFARLEGARVGRKDEFCQEAMRELAKTLQDQGAEVISAAGISLTSAKLLCKGIIDRLQSGMKVDPSDRRVELEIKEPCKYAAPNIEAGIRGLLDRNSRYEAAKSLIFLDDATNPLREKFIFNVFGIRRELSPLGLRIIYLLAEQRGQFMPVQQLLSELDRHGYTDEVETRDVFNSMIDTDRRLLAIAVDADFQSYSEIKCLTTQNVQLTPVGRNYYERLVWQPVYIQAMLPRLVGRGCDDEPRESSRHEENFRILNRLDETFDALKNLVENEFSRLGKPWNSRIQIQWRPVDLECQSAAGDVYTKSLERFVTSCCSHFHNLRQESNGNAHRVAELTFQWIDFGRQMMLKHAEIFKSKNQNWEVRIGEADRLAERNMGREYANLRHPQVSL
ncbi:MAG: hypothetical protein NTY77_14980 [Elusimicrobia bacterium]|nr:hypothetical protein [Elusimicrobiota bacterium]